MSGRKGDLNVRGAFVHLASDAVITFGVVLTGLAMLYTGWTWLDPIVSLMIVALIVYGTWGLLRDSVNLALDAVPQGIDMNAVKEYLANLPTCADVHDLHVWGMSTTETALTAHVWKKRLATMDCSPKSHMNCTTSSASNIRLCKSSSATAVSLPLSPCLINLLRDKAALRKTNCRSPCSS
jgi:cation diffusion facilitator family transporter